MTLIDWPSSAYRDLDFSTIQRFGVNIFFKEMNTFVQQGHIKLNQSDSEDIYNVTIDFILYLYFILYSSNNPEKSTPVSTKILSSATVFNMDNKNCFLSSKLAY